MEKMLKVPLMMFAITLGIFLVAGTAGAEICCVQSVVVDGDFCNPADVTYMDCPGGNGGVAGCGGHVAYAPGDVVTHNAAGPVVFTTDMIAPVGLRHGLIIGATGVVINGCDQVLDGGAAAGRNCEVDTYLEDDCGGPPNDPRIWCTGHPCRQASDQCVEGRCRCIDANGNNMGNCTCANGLPCTPLQVGGVWVCQCADGNPCDCDAGETCTPLLVNVDEHCCIDSGILNAYSTWKDAQNDIMYDGDGGGCSGHVPCQGGCDSVTVKNLKITGWCDGIFMSGDCQDTGRGNEYRLTWLRIQGNAIYNNGNHDCGVYTPATCEGGCDWERHYYNDAIFLAAVGIDSAGPGLNPACEEYRDANDVEYPDLITGGAPLPANRNIVEHNKIRFQYGCGCVSCPGGNGINLNGGVEEEPFFWSGCNEIAYNLVRDCDMSGIQYQHTTKFNRIHGNLCVENGLGGITDPCGWCEDHYIYDNVCRRNFGPGIGVNAMARIKKNISSENRAIPADSRYNQSAAGFGCLGYPCGGIGILCGGGDGASELRHNTCCCNQTFDIFDAKAGTPGGAYGSSNMCDNPDGYNAPDGCEYSCASPRHFTWCPGDINVDCRVNFFDRQLFFGEMGDACCNPMP